MPARAVHSEPHCVCQEECQQWLNDSQRQAEITTIRTSGALVVSAMQEGSEDCLFENGETPYGFTPFPPERQPCLSAGALMPLQL